MFNQKPRIIELGISKDYPFMYENFVISTQRDTYLMLNTEDDIVSAIRFIGATIKYGGPNDAGRGAHPLTKYGDFIYGLYEVENSPWIKEQMVGNRIHPRHTDDLYSDKKHYVACFKDVMFEASCRGYEVVSLSKKDVFELITREISNLDE